MQDESRSPRSSCLVLVAVLLVGAAGTSSSATKRGPFLIETDAAMAKMMRAMNIVPSGDVDADFVAVMAPHHQGAIEMAQAELRYGQNELLRRLAHEIIVEQQQEIAAMRMAISDRTARSPKRELSQQEEQR